MNAAMPFPQSEFSRSESAGTPFRSIFEHAPLPVARCDRHGVIVEMNPAFERSLDPNVNGKRSLRLGELVLPQEREKTESLLCDLLNARRESIGIVARSAGNGHSSTRWTAWRQPGSAGDPDHALLIAELASPDHPVADHSVTEPHVDDGFLQTQRWEAIGRLAGGVVHDFNNLLTGVMLYCDLLLSSLDARDHRRRYAEEIRAAIVQSAGLVRQLLVFARPRVRPPQLVSLNKIAQEMKDLLTRLIGENISLHLHLDPDLGLVEIDQAQAQQVVLNLVLNARDALPDGGQITIETRNCRFQPVTGAQSTVSPSVFPCVLLEVTDNGQGMSLETQRRLFEPFFTTKNAGEGTGLGLTTVRTILTTHRGLIHFDSQPGRGTRVMILLPREAQSSDSAAPQPVDSDSALTAPDANPVSTTPFQKINKEPLL